MLWNHSGGPQSTGLGQCPSATQLLWISGLTWMEHFQIACHDSFVGFLPL